MPFLEFALLQTLPSTYAFFKAFIAPVRFEAASAQELIYAI